MQSRFLQARDDRAVSPVIGVILMVAITVILAAVIGAFVFGLGDQIQETAPNTQVSITEINEGENVTFAHNGGGTFNEDNTEEIRVTSGGDEVQSFSMTDFADNQFRAGDQETTDEGGGQINSGDTVRVVWVGQDRSSVIAQRQA